MGERLLCRDAAPSATDHDRKLDLPVDALRHLRIDHNRISGCRQRGGKLRANQGYLRRRLTRLTNVIHVIEADRDDLARTERRPRRPMAGEGLSPSNDRRQLVKAELE